MPYILLCTYVFVVVQSVSKCNLSATRHYNSEEGFIKVTDKIKTGDIIGVKGRPGENIKVASANCSGRQFTTP